MSTIQDQLVNRLNGQINEFKIHQQRQELAAFLKEVWEKLEDNLCIGGELNQWEKNLVHAIKDLDIIEIELFPTRERLQSYIEDWYCCTKDRIISSPSLSYGEHLLIDLMNDPIVKLGLVKA